MSDLLSEFERDCQAKKVSPTEALKRGGVHPSLWWKWKAGKVSPTLRTFEAAKEGLDRVESDRAA
jgi:hypothetical protein